MSFYCVVLQKSIYQRAKNVILLGHAQDTENYKHNLRFFMTETVICNHRSRLLYSGTVSTSCLILCLQWILVHQKNAIANR